MKIFGLEQKYTEALELTKKQLEIAFDGEIEFRKGDQLRVYKDGEKVIVEYSELCEVYRGFSFVDRVVNTGEKIEQKARVSIRGTMADCSRNGVLTNDAVKELIINSAAMGFNCLILYTEDIYEVPEYEYFGHKRGAYSKADLKSFAEFAKLFGMQFTLHFQTLGHLGRVSAWPCFDEYFETPHSLMPESEKTYEFIENEIKAVAEVVNSEYLFIGMDEAYGMGRGRYLDENGYTDSKELFYRHVEKVCEICKKYGFKAVIPTDMYFVMQSGCYYTNNTRIPKECVERMPDNLVFEWWDYYYQPDENDVIENMNAAHVETGHETWFCCGAWCWHGITPKNYYSNYVTPNSVEIAIKYGIDAIVDFTFGDDGGECSIFGVMPAILRTAEQLYNQTDDDEINRRSTEIFGISFDDYMKIDSVCRLGEEYDYQDRCPSTLEKAILYNDIMIGLMNDNIKHFDLETKFAEDAKSIRQVKSKRYAELFETQATYADFLDAYWDLPIKVKAAYNNGDKAVLKALCENDIPKAQETLEIFYNAFNKQWLRFCKPIGFEVQQVRIGGVMLRLKSARERILQYVNGEIDALLELEHEDKPWPDPACGIRGTHIWWRAFSKSTLRELHEHC